MGRLNSSSDKPTKTSRDQPKPRRRNSPATARDPSPAPSQDPELTQLIRERDEALQREAATAEILRLVSGSNDLEAVFSAILESATRICGATFGTLFIADGDAFGIAAMHNAPPAYVEARQRQPRITASPFTALGRVARTKQVVQIPDIREDLAYTTDPGAASNVALAFYRTVLMVPMLKDEELVGAIAINRQEVRLFSDKDIELLQNFAAQAVIAIENARLLNELRQRTTDLTESLEQQTATANVLRVISSSPGELDPVFQAALANATNLCGAKFGTLFIADGDAFRVAAMHNAPSALVEARRREPRIQVSPLTALGRVVRTKQIVQIADIQEDPAYLNHPTAVTNITFGLYRTILMVPMLREGDLVGAIAIHRQEVCPFTDKQIALVQSFAAQAVIAIENTRLLNELRQRTTDLSEALEQQTATSEVLRIISSSPGKLEPVFRAILENATRICEAKLANIYRFDGSAFHFAGTVGSPLELIEHQQRRGPFQPKSGTVLDRLKTTKRTVQCDDLAAEAAPNPVAKLGGGRSSVSVPLLKDDQLIGSITIYRKEVRPFTEKQIALLQNFADQAVIAIENTRLLNELHERTSDLERSYETVQEQASQLEAQSQELKQLNQHLEERVAEQVGEIERMGRLRRFLPPQVADLIVASGTEQLESHRREITALFCDLRGFTGFSESADPEDVIALLREYHATAGGIINKYSGTLERYAGDGVMVIFNDPVPVPQPALQAVQAALDMREALKALTDKWSRLGHDLGFGIGIAHGHATLGTIGFEGRFDYAAIGTVSNVASRLCDEAKPGQILITSRVYMAVEDAVTVDPIGEFTLKGIRRPMAVYNVVGVKPAN